MRSHPLPDELRALLCGALTRDQARKTIRHLLNGCTDCRTVLAPAVEALLRKRRLEAPPPEPDSAYDRAMERALATALRHQRHLRRESAKIREGVDRLLAAGAEGFQHFPVRLWGLAGYQALLQRSWALRHENPGQMVAMAQLATLAASRLSVSRYGERQIKDLECRATIELANAYRVANRLEEAQSALDRAAALWTAGTEDPFLRARYFDIQGVVYGDRRLFEAAFRAFDKAHRIYQRMGDRHLAARSLITKGLYTGYAGDPERAISLLNEGLASCNRQLEPQMARAATFNIAWFSVDCGRLRDARRLIWQHRHEFEGAGHLEMLRLHWLEGLISAGLKDLERAEITLREVRQGLLDADVPYIAAIVSLDLASIWMTQGKHEQARTIVLEAAQVFLDLKIGREAMAAVLLLRTTFEFRLATSALLSQVAQFLRNEKEPPMTPPTRH